MTTHSTPRPPDPLLSWERDLRTAVIGDLSPATVGAIAGAVAVGALGTTVAAAAVAAAAEGGVTMTTITASAASNVALKAAAWGLAATLAVGGTAAVTGSLPDGAQEFTADAAAHIGLTLPRPDTSVSGSLDLAVGDVITVGGAGRIGARLDGGAIVLTGIEAASGFEATIVSQTEGVILVEFHSATETATVLLTSVNGSIVSDVDFETNAEADAQAEAEADAEADAEAEAEADAEAGLDITLGG